MKKVLFGLGTILSTSSIIATISCGDSESGSSKGHDDHDYAKEESDINKIKEYFKGLDGSTSSNDDHANIFPTDNLNYYPTFVGFNEPTIPDGFSVEYSYIPNPLFGSIKVSTLIKSKNVTRAVEFEILGFKNNLDVLGNFVGFCNDLESLKGKTTLKDASKLNNEYLVSKNEGGLIPSKPEDIGFVAPKLISEVGSLSYSTSPGTIPGTVKVTVMVMPSPEAVKAGAYIVEKHFELTGFGTMTGKTYLY